MIVDDTLFGNIEQCQAGTLLGWVASKRHAEPITVRVMANGKLIGRGIANLYREDLKAAGINEGKHAFKIPLEELRALGEDIHLSLVEEHSLTPVEHPFFSISYHGPLLQGRIEQVDGSSITVTVKSNHNLTEQTAILLVDGLPVASKTFNDEDDSCCSFSMEIPAKYIDGRPHTIQLSIDGYSDCLASCAEVLRPLSYPWSTALKDIPASSSHFKEARYTTLVDRLLNISNGTNSLEVDALTQACELLKKYQQQVKLEFLSSYFRNDASIAVVVPFLGDMESFCHTMASIAVAFNESPFKLVVLTREELVGSLEGDLPLNSEILVNDQGLNALDISFLVDSIDVEFIALVQPGFEVEGRWLDRLVAPFSKAPLLSITFGKTVDHSGALLNLVDTNFNEFKTNPFSPEVNYQQHIAPTSELFVLRTASLKETHSSSHLSLYVPGSTSYCYFSETEKLHVNGLEDAYSLPPKRNKVLFIDSQVPSLGRDAGSYAAIQEMKLVQGLGFDVTFCPENLKNIDGNTEFLQSQGIEVLYAPFYQSVYDVVTKRGHEFSAVYITRYGVAEKWIELIRSFIPHAKILFNNADLHFLRELRQALALNDPKAIEASLDTRERELEVCKKVDAVLCYNTTEQAVITSHTLEAGKLYTTPWVLESQGLGFPLERRQGLVFLGSAAHAPNIDALNFLHDKVMPLLRAERPDIRLYVYGSGMEGLSSTYNSENIVIKGFARSLDDVFHQHRVFVCPLSFGAGIKGKVLDAMTYGVPCVLSDIAAEGTGLEQGVNTLIAHSEKEWAEAIIKLYEDEELWNSLSNNSKKLAASKYSFEHGLSVFKHIFQSLNIKSTT
ncbi:TPA: glycosyltransferase family 4 protein [Vibrio parahaemolyticus]|nr:glycosyltransferase family 4 protein [Vibrio parahaemolyticus]HCG6494750.1 glycosyltransferase family 4 protein [Vibrio parahaemolyticus]